MALFRPWSSRFDAKTGKRKRLKTWYGQYRDKAGKLIRTPLSPNKVVAQEMLAALILGVEQSKSPKRQEKSLEAHLEDWADVLRARGIADAKYKVNRVRRLALEEPLSAAQLEKTLGAMRANGTSAQTSNNYLQAAKQFTRWLLHEGRIDRDPFAVVRGANVRVDRRRIRRAATDDELQRLLEAAGSGPERLGLSGPDRVLLYLAALFTGLRASELASLTPESFTNATVTVEAGYSKHRREDVLPLHRVLQERLLPWVRKPSESNLRSKPSEFLWPGRWASSRHAGRMLALDLVAARVPVRTAEGVLDFHALRHTFITRLVLAGVSPKEAQTLARHSTITLTLDRYCSIGLHDAARALEKLPSPSSAKKTG